MKRVLVGMLTLGIVCAFTPALMSADKDCPLAAATAGKTCPLTGKVIQTAAKDCEKSKTVAAAGAKACCKDAKAQTVAAAGEKACAKSKTVAASAKTCPVTGKVIQTAAKDGEKACAKTVAAAGKKACCAEAQTVAAADCEAACAKAKTVAAAGEKACAKSKTVAAAAKTCPLTGKVIQTAAKDGEKACAKTVAAAGAKDCAKAKSQTVAAGEKACAKSKTVAAAAKTCPLTGKVIQTAAKDGEKACAKTVAAGEKACSKSKTVAAKGDCPIEKAVQAAAAVTFRVGDFQTSDGQAAFAAATRTGKDVKFVVGDESFCNVADAAVAINKRIDAKIGEMTTVAYAVGKDCVSCPNAAASLAKQANAPVMYRVANVDFKDRQAAEKAAKRAKQAVGSTLMAYQVGEDSFCCDKMAGEAAVASGKPVQYLIQGKATSCQLDAALKMATAKMQALFQAVAAPQSS